MSLSEAAIAEKLASLPEEQQARVAELLRMDAEYARTNKIERYKPYAWQSQMHAGGAYEIERMLRAANQTGKTHSAGSEVSFHATGEYPEPWPEEWAGNWPHQSDREGDHYRHWPDGWQGKRFDKHRALVIWVGSKTNTSSRDIVQAELLGDIEAGEEIGTGTIPKRCIQGKPKTRQCGIANVVDYVWIKRKNGGRCKIQFLTYEMGWQKWQGKRVHVVWLDEEPARGDFPTDEDYKIFTEAQTRIAANEGIVLVTFTPLAGLTPLVEHFDKDLAGIGLYTATWDDAPHLSKKMRDFLRESYPAHEVEARTRGVPMVGSGRVWTHDEEDIKVAPFEIPSWWPRLCGIDFGIDHPQAAVWVAWDRDADIAYVCDGYRKSNESIPTHASAMKKRGKWVPVAWPHDGEQKDKSRPEKRIADLYRDEGVYMMQLSARYDDKVGGAQPQEPIILDMDERMREGRLRVFSHLDFWFEEYRNFHRKDGRLVNRKDDALKATMYALMMKRYATTEPKPVSRRRLTRPILSSRLKGAA